MPEILLGMNKPQNLDHEAFADTMEGGSTAVKKVNDLSEDLMPRSLQMVQMVLFISDGKFKASWDEQV